MARKEIPAEARLRGAWRGGEVMRERAWEANAPLLATIIRWRFEGATQAEIARRLNQQGHTTRTGRPFDQVTISRIRRRSRYIFNGVISED
jgi:hypothetical protein